MKEEWKSAADVLKLLGDKTRLTIIISLEKKERCVCEFVELFDISQPAISQHLRKLKDASLILEERRGQWIYYRLHKNHPQFSFVQHIIQALPMYEEKNDLCCEE